ncbi:hypothetical protein J2809_004201 [Arthrobacter pascens]|uniref:hypothetical protein n=1 Tax=Arthrobacter pascens TaxID=1677 RepID=UPI00286132AB|nr:hypothetical protein [Arthrobacter pascens]MDR6559818.1 hypothetical protein [Arthrobacter pascens]
MEISVPVLKDVAELVTATSDAVKSLVEALTAALAKGASGFDSMALRRDRRRLVDLSAGLTNLASSSNRRVVGSLDDYLAATEPTYYDWLAVLESFDIALFEVQNVLNRLYEERGGFVLQDAYAVVSEGLHARTHLLERLRSMEQPTDGEAISELHRINAEYKKLILRMRRAVRALNTYVREEYFNQLSDEEMTRHIPFAK